jgi:thymidine kinase|tara:strand:- start:696 stop:1355 length:660 start_codon:yes stop_codon:yes gene_type:complete
MSTIIKERYYFIGEVEMGLTIIMGNMFSGKTSELIRRLKRYRVIGKKIVVINSSKDTRCPEEVLNTHDGIQFPCLKVEHISHCIVKESFCKAEIVAIDEAQFFENLKEFVEMCLFLKKSVILAGLDGDYKQRKFGEIIDCIPIASDVVKLSALCMDCKDGTPGPFTKRIVQSEDLELVGGNDMYKAVCRRHLKPTDVKDKNNSFLQAAFEKAMDSRMVE